MADSTVKDGYGWDYYNDRPVPRPATKQDLPNDAPVISSSAQPNEKLTLSTLALAETELRKSASIEEIFQARLREEYLRGYNDALFDVKLQIEKLGQR